MTPSQKKEIEEVFDEKFLDKNAASGVNTREYPNLPKLIQEIKFLLFSELEKALAEQREELREKIDEIEKDGLGVGLEKQSQDIIARIRSFLFQQD